MIQKVCVVNVVMQTVNIVNIVALDAKNIFKEKFMS